MGLWQHKRGEIKRIRKVAGWTQVQAAIAMGYCLRTWQAWEQGERPMRMTTFEHFKRIAQEKEPNGHTQENIPRQ